VGLHIRLLIITAKVTGVFLMIYEFIGIYLFGIITGIFVFGFVIIAYCLDGGEIRVKYEKDLRDLPNGN
jgi:hypothetical protein